MSESSEPKDARSSVAGPHLLLVVGNSRSGTSVLARALGLHDDLVDLGETHFADELLPAGPVDELLRGNDARTFADSLQERLAFGLHGQRGGTIRSGLVLPNELTAPIDLFLEVAAFQMDSAAGHLIEQTPGHLYHARRILDASSKASVVMIVRDPRAVVYSNCKRWRAARRWAKSPSAYLEVVRSWAQGHSVLQSLLWRRGARAGLALERDYPDRVTRITYEDLIGDAETSLRSICAAIGVDFQPSMLDVDVQGSSSSPNDPGARGFQARSSTPAELRLRDGAHRIVESLCDVEMQALGYDRTGRGSLASIGVEALTLPKVAIGVLISVSRMDSIKESLKERLS